MVKENWSGYRGYRIRATRILAALVLFGMATHLCHSQEYSPQVIFIYDHRDDSGLHVVRPKGEVILGLRPLSGQPAPLPVGSYMICRPFSQEAQLLVAGKLMPIKLTGFRCGSDRFLFTDLDIH